MSEFHQQTKSPWQDTLRTPNFSSLKTHRQTDVCIVGGGISGLTTAYLLIRKGFRVVLVEKETFGQNETGFSTAHVSNALDDRYMELRKWHGAEGLRKAYQSHTEAIRFIEKLVKDEHIECGFQRVDGYLFMSQEQDRSLLEQEMEAAKAAGFEDVELLDQAPNSFFKTGPCLRFPQQAQMDPLKYVAKLAELVKLLGGEIYTETKALEISGGNHAFVRTDGNCIVSCRHIVVATNVPVNDWVTMHTKESAYRSYAIGIKVPHGQIPTNLFWDTADPYHYVRVQPNFSQDHDLLIVGGEDHRVGQEPDPQIHYSNLKEWARWRLGVSGEIAYQWSGQIIETIDGLAYIGRNPRDEKNVYIASGDSGHGITHGTIAGMILSDLIAEGRNKWAAVYDPARFHWQCLKSFLSENLQGVAQYKEWFKNEDTWTIETLPRGEGMVLSDNFSKIAIYKDEGGQIHKFSAVCPHMKGVLNWNSSEKTWDCPVHGSRFSKMGETLNGPAVTNLENLAEAERPEQAHFY